MGLQVTLDNDGIFEAIGDYVAKQGINTVDKDLVINLKAGRGTNGFSATVDITTSEQKAANPVVLSRGDPSTVDNGTEPGASLFDKDSVNGAEAG